MEKGLSTNKYNEMLRGIIAKVKMTRVVIANRLSASVTQLYWNTGDGDFLVADWLQNRNTLEYIGIGEKVYNPTFNYGEFTIIKSQAGLLRIFTS